MRNVLLIIALAVVAIPANGEAPQFSLSPYNLEFDRRQRAGMIVLGSWAALNFAGNGIPYLFVSNEALSDLVRNFMLMNIGWNVINGALAGSGYFTCCRKDPGEINLGETVKRQHVAEKTFLFNAGLDFGYMAFGLFLTELSKSRENPAVLTGFGHSLIVQRAALFIFDVAMQIAHARHRSELDSHLAGL